MISADSFQCNSLKKAKEGAGILRILAASINAVEPGNAVKKYVHLTGEQLSVQGKNYRLEKYRSVRLWGIGKAAVGMSSSLASILGERLSGGLVITKHAPDSGNYPFHIMEGGHPIPNSASQEAGRRSVQFLSELSEDDLLICLISGGGSALVSSLLDGISLEDLQAMTTTLLACGARIDEINCLRRRLERTKGGGVVKLSHGATIISLILSDVIGNPLEAIASGPTAPEPSSQGDAQVILQKYDLHGKIPLAIEKALKGPDICPKPDDPMFARVHNVVVGSVIQAAQAGLTQAQAEGFTPYLLRVDQQGEARQAAFELATTLRQARKTSHPAAPPACMVAGGETTVTLSGDGKGGRNTELALAASIELADFPGVMLISLATDGEDGPTDAAGAVVSGETYQRAEGMGMSAEEYLARNDSYSFFSELGDLLKPGPTGTNVNDLIFMFAF
jgi:glycerate 2-kinase